MKKILFAFLSLIGMGAIVFGAMHYARHTSRKERRFVTSISEQWRELLPQAKKEPLPTVVREVLQQPFFFLGRGRQTSVFVSADGTCVLKLFRDVEKKRKQKRLKESLLGAALAKKKLADETGLIFCSLVGTRDEPSLVTLLTKKGKIETVDLSSTPFLLQKKALPLQEALLRLRTEGKIDQAKESVISLFKLLDSCRKKHVVDRDGSLIRNGNIGFLGTQAVLLDTGKLCILKNRKKHTLHDLNRLKPLTSWCKEAFPELLSTIKDCRKKYWETGASV